MKPLDRDRSVLEHILSYCEQIETTIDPEVTWEVMTEDIPALRSSCHDILTTERV